MIVLASVSKAYRGDLTGLHKYVRLGKIQGTNILVASSFCVNPDPILKPKHASGEPLACMFICLPSRPKGKI